MIASNKENRRVKKRYSGVLVPRIFGNFETWGACFFVAIDGEKLVSGLFSDLKVEMERLIITLQKVDSRNATRSISTYLGYSL
jgi:hypothetical protein